MVELLSREKTRSGSGIKRYGKLCKPLARLSLVAILFLFCVGCETTEGPGSVYCPQPNTREIDDYAVIVEAGPDRPAVRWVARVIAYCWPDEAR